MPFIEFILIFFIPVVYTLLKNFNACTAKTAPIAFASYNEENFSMHTYTPPLPTICLRSSFTSIKKRHSHIYNSKRTMFTRCKQIAQNSIPKLNLNVKTRSYTTWGSRPPKINPKDPKCDPKALSNNDKGHTEIVKGECSNESCGDKICQVSCTESQKVKVIAHFTHSNYEDLAKGKKNVELNPDTDYDGNQKAQNAVVYHEGHNLHPNSMENSKATEFLHKDSGAAIKIVDDAIAKLQKKK